MSEEILKVLEKLKNKSNYQRDCNDGSYFIELFANEIYILCKFMEDLQQKVEQLEKENEATLKNYGNLVKEWKQLENIRKEIKEYIEKQVVCCKNGDMLVELNVDDLLNILNKGSDKSEII